MSDGTRLRCLRVLLSVALMLPKVATQIVHTASRAAASIHQAHTIRNVLQLQSTSSAPPSGALAPWNAPGSSNWGSNGPGPGGAKHNKGSRFQYNNAGRAVTQANPISANDGSFNQTDDAEEVTSQPSQKRTRTRSRSVSLSSQDHPEKLGVLKTIQLHARSRHAFAPPTLLQPTTLPSENATPDVDPPRPPLVRRNSTSAPPPSDTFDRNLPAPAIPQAFARLDPTASSHLASSSSDASASTTPRSATPPTPLSPTDPAAPQTVDPPVLQNTNVKSPHIVFLDQARDGGDFDTALDVVRKFIQESESPSISEYNAALEALHVTRRPGEPLHVILGTYNQMLKRSVLPDATTYVILIDALTSRDVEIRNSINTLELRSKHRKLTGRLEVASDMADKKRIESLQREDNFKPAMSLFSTLISIDGNNTCQPSTYLGLLQSCAARGDVDGAIHVFAQMEKRNSLDSKARLPPSPMFYKYLIQAYTNAGGTVNDVEEVFRGFQAAHQRDAIFKDLQDPATTIERHVKVWNQMIETYFRFRMPDMAVGLVEQMLVSQPDSAEPRAAPPVAASTFTTVLAGFCQMGDVPTALVWFDRLLQQASTEEDFYASLDHPMQPDPVAWSIMFDALASQGMIQDLNRLFSLRREHAPKKSKQTERSVVFRANMEHLESLEAEQFSQTMDFLVKHFVGQDRPSLYMITELWQAYLSRDMHESAVLLLANYMNSAMGVSAVDKEVPSPSQAMQRMQLAFSKQLYERTQGRVQFAVVLQLARLADKVRVIQQEDHIPLFLHSYGMSRAAGTIPVHEMNSRDWELLLCAAVEVETAAIQGRPIHTYVEGYAFEGVVSLLADLSKDGVSIEEMNSALIQRIVRLIHQQHGSDGLQALFQGLGPSFVTALGNSNQETATLAQPSVAETLRDPGCSSPDFRPDTLLRIDPSQTKSINAELWTTTPATGAPAAYAKFRKGVEDGVAPSPSVIGLLIQNLGRRHLIKELHYTYTVARAVLRLLDPKKAYQGEAWLTIEDSMVIALAHHGDVDGAHVHRMRILEQGGAPTADAYGALIYNVKDTTDDTSNAMALFNESQRLGVSPNQYLYNNIISKLAKARKADYALELFQQMKATNCQPTSVTYGAVIGACARVGDVQSAESLFTEMVSSKHFKARVPPYNTMMQLYTTTKPNRERALHYYNELRKARISPSGHTYKLLMDAFGAIEPVDVQGMENVFEQLRREKGVTIQATHFASLINAHGCVQKDLDKAIQIFNSIPSYPGAQPPDAVVFESMINALVANRQTHLIPEWLERMNAAGVHMTAYIANFLIRGYSMVGDIEKARSVFESLEDPPEGIAAPNNHAPHDPSSSALVDCAEPVYREPSTWEAMVRAELGSGNRSGALELLERLKTRQYPEAVYKRISGIMVDHSMVLS